MVFLSSSSFYLPRALNITFSYLFSQTRRESLVSDDNKNKLWNTVLHSDDKTQDKLEYIIRRDKMRGNSKKKKIRKKWIKDKRNKRERKWREIMIE